MAVLRETGKYQLKGTAETTDMVVGRKYYVPTELRLTRKEDGVSVDFVNLEVQPVLGGFQKENDEQFDVSCDEYIERKLNSPDIGGYYGC